MAAIELTRSQFKVRPASQWAGTGGGLRVTAGSGGGSRDSTEAGFVLGHCLAKQNGRFVMQIAVSHEYLQDTSCKSTIML